MKIKSAYKILYGDGSTFSGRKGELPIKVRNVQVVINFPENQKPYFQTRADYYIPDYAGNWRGCDIDGLKDFLDQERLVHFGSTIHQVKIGDTWRGVDIFGLIAQIEKMRIVLFGRTIDPKMYNILLEQAFELTGRNG